MTEKVDPIVPTRSGNTKQISPAKNWCFTLFWTDEKGKDAFIDLVKKSSSKHIVGLETCPETGRKHLQGYCQFANKVRPTSIFKGFKPHWEKAKGTDIENVQYCSKESVISSNMYIPRLPKILDENQLYDWQKDIVKYVKGPVNDREIVWIYDKPGNHGKSKLVSYLIANHHAVPILGKRENCLNMVFKFDSNCYLYDVPRDYQEYLSYPTIEMIKSETIVNEKYECGYKQQAIPHLIIFANFKPNIKSLSLDRWKIYDIQKLKLVDITDKLIGRHNLLEDDDD